AKSRAKNRAGLVGPAVSCYRIGTTEFRRQLRFCQFLTVTASTTWPGLKSHRFSELKLHDQCQILQLMLKNWQRAPGHLHATGSIESRLGGNPIATAHQENLQQFSGFARIDHSALQKIAPQ